MNMELRPSRGGFMRPFGAGWFIREYLRGNGPEGSAVIDPERGAPQSDINYEYKVSLATTTARTRLDAMQAGELQFMAARPLGQVFSDLRFLIAGRHVGNLNTQVLAKPFYRNSKPIVSLDP